MTRPNVVLYASWLVALLTGPVLLFVVDGYDLPGPTADPASFLAMLALVALVDTFAFVVLLAWLGWGYVSAGIVLAVFVGARLKENYVGAPAMTSESAVGYAFTVPALAVVAGVLAAVEYGFRVAVGVGLPAVP